ncbi:MAG: hypothetical protein RTU30_09380 [Candidatus Thorarchaeota archaeon]
MIDDDFQRIFRKLMEQFFGDANPFSPEGSVTRGFSFDYESGEAMPKNPLDSQAQTEVEKIELDDRVIVVVSGLKDIVPPKVKVFGETLVIIDPSGVNDEIMTLPYSVDVIESHATIRNGIMEITLFKANDIDRSSEVGEHVLKIS